MPEVKYLTKDGTESKKVKLTGELFESEPKEHIIQSYVVGYLRNQRQGTGSSLNRARMKGGGAKPYRQKGTGRARAGTNISPIWTGGAIAFGPTPRDFYRKMPATLKRNALKSALSKRVKDGGLIIVEAPDVTEAKTKVIADYLKNLGVYHQKTILIYDGKNDNLLLASRNIKYFNVKRAELINAYDLVWHEKILITDAGLSIIKEKFGND